MKSYIILSLLLSLFFNCKTKKTSSSLTNTKEKIQVNTKQDLSKQKKREITILEKQNISTKWYGKYHFVDEEGHTAGGDWTGHYTKYNITKDSVHLTTSGRMSGREDYYISEEKQDTLLLYRYQRLTGDKELYEDVELEKMYKRGNSYYILINEFEKKLTKK